MWGLTGTSGWETLQNTESSVQKNVSFVMSVLSINAKTVYCKANSGYYAAAFLRWTTHCRVGGWWNVCDVFSRCRLIQWTSLENARPSNCAMLLTSAFSQIHSYKSNTLQNDLDNFNFKQPIVIDNRFNMLIID